MNCRLAGLVTLALATASLAACSRHASAADCAALLDRYVELLVREQDPKAPDTEIARQKAATRAKAEKDTAFASCPTEVSVKSARCAMIAVNVDEFEKCLE
jgi:protein-disulfide isomerase